MTSFYPFTVAGGLAIGLLAAKSTVMMLVNIIQHILSQRCS
jgi:hypothetical protein